MGSTGGHGRLTTHVLDNMAGVPAAGVRIVLHRLDGTATQTLVDTATNDDGRVDRPLLDGDALTAATYELVFHVGDYYRARGVDLPDPAFLETVPVRFGIADTGSHYHVPLLISPYSYATYRGS